MVIMWWSVLSYATAILFYATLIALTLWWCKSSIEKTFKREQGKFNEEITKTVKNELKRQDTAKSFMSRYNKG